MKVHQSRWVANSGWTVRSGSEPVDAQLVLVFGATALLNRSELITEIRAKNSRALVFGCSTAGEISGTEVTDDSLVVTAIQFEHTKIHSSQASLSSGLGSEAAGEQIARGLPSTLPTGEKLNHVMVLADGLKTNGTRLVWAMANQLPTNVKITGGLAGDGPRFAETVVLTGGLAQRDMVVAVGFYGDRLEVGCSAFGGWDPFGPERLVTKSNGNILYELDGQSALALYKKYLGTQAKDLPGSALLFPLCMRTKTGETGVVRTILAVNEADQSMTFAGDMPEGSRAQLMMANFDRLISGAGKAAESSWNAAGAGAPELAVLISCVGRKLVLKQRIEEEVEAVRDELGAGTVLTGFYSYGEISPFGTGGKCELHNQTMTVIHFTEK